ncbi:hypothetical protein ACIQC8_05265 [Agrococcus sediminis]|uniref:hypothetical protein n=1 Tax=Agrococcus sediminis TaxID=2599924 RepID=UPI00382DCBF3
MDDEGATGPATIAGLQLVRALRHDGEREAWVASDASGSAVEVHRSRAGADDALAREAEAVLAAAHPHLVPILDVATDGGAVVIRPLLPRDLAAWLLQRGAPAPGEAVTALAPVAAALAALHSVGAAVDGFGAQDVRLDPDGAPLLLAAGARVETARPTEAWRDASPAVAADVDAWRRLAATVVEAAGAALPAAVETALERRDLAAAGDALLAAWPGLPLALDPPPARGEAEHRAGARGGQRHGAGLRRRDRAGGVDALWSRAALLLDRAAARGGPLLERARGAAGSVRPRFWAIAGASAVAGAIALGLALPAGSAGADAPSDDAPAATAPTAPASTAPTDPTRAPDASHAADAAAGAVTADPLAGAAALLAEREACLDAGDAACLVGLHEPDSPQLVADEPWRMPDDGRLEVVQQLGDAWLLRVVSETAPASMLAMSTEAGWVLRDAWSAQPGSG